MKEGRCQKAVVWGGGMKGEPGHRWAGSYLPVLGGLQKVEELECSWHG